MCILMLILKYVIHRDEGWDALGLCGKVLVEGGLGLCLLQKEARSCPMSDRVNASQLQG